MIESFSKIKRENASVRTNAFWLRLPCSQFARSKWHELSQQRPIPVAICQSTHPCRPDGRATLLFTLWSGSPRISGLDGRRRIRGLGLRP